MAFKHPVLPYRAGVGILVVDRDANVLIMPGCEGEPANSWRMPEGALGMGESEREAAQRVLHDQAGLLDARVLAQAPGWFAYELPCDEQGIGLGGLYCGQRLKWFAMAATNESVARPKSDGARLRHAPGRWVESAAVPALAAGFKRQLYEDVVATFAPLLMLQASPFPAPRSPVALRRP